MIAFVRRVLCSTQFLYLLSFLLFIVALLQTPFADTDFGWHYRYGEYIVNNRAILYHNIFSFTFTDYMWANSYWMAQVVFFLLFGIHPVLISLFLGLLFFSTLAFFARKLHLSVLTFAVTSLLFAVFLNQFFASVRPLGFSSVFLLLELGILLFFRKKIFWLPVLFALWANFHADFVLGLFIFGIYILVEIFDFARGRLLFTTVLKDFGVLLFSCIATFINPYGDFLWHTLLKEAHPYQFSHINEWVPMRYDPLLPFVLYCSILGLSIFVVSFSRVAVPTWLKMAILFFIIISVRSVYFSRIVGLLALLPLALEIDILLQKLPSIDGKSLIIRITNSILLLSLFLLAPILIEKFALSHYAVSWSTFYHYPHEAVSYIKKHKLEGNMFNDYSWGGYLIYALPEKKTYVDGRMASWREGSRASLEEYINVVDYPQDYIGLLEEYSIDFVLEKPETTLVKFLATNPEWELLYDDDDSALFMRLRK